MSDDKQPAETQQELFTQFSSAPKRPERFPALAKTQKPILLSTTLEQLLMAGIILILLLCAVFFLGVLRGKSLKPGPVETPSVERASAPRTVPPPAPRRAAAAAVVPAAPALPAATIPVRPASAVSADRPYTIQLVTYRKKEYAETELAAVRKMGFSGFVVQKGEYFLVYVGQYASKDEAKKDLAAFQGKYKDSFLTRRA